LHPLTSWHRSECTPFDRIDVGIAQTIPSSGYNLDDCVLKECRQKYLQDSLKKNDMLVLALSSKKTFTLQNWRC
jgi:hypothetical protein